MAPRKPPKIVQLTHVRVCIGIDQCALTVYSAIDDFYKMELSTSEGKPFVKRWIVSPKGNKIRVEAVASKDLLQVMTGEWEDWMRLGIAESMEVELNFTSPLQVETTASRLALLLKRPKFRVKKLVFNNGTAQGFQQAIVDLCDRKYLRLIHKRIMYPDPTSVYPVYILDHFVPNYLDGLPMRFSSISLKWVHFNKLRKALIALALKSGPGTYWALRAPHEKPFQALCQCPNKCQLQEHGRELVGDVVLRHKVSECGYFLIATRLRDEGSINWDSERCGQAEFCANCTSSFEHDYFHDLPRRALEDPQWSHVFIPMKDVAEQERMLKKLRFLIQKTSSISVRRAEEGYKLGTVDLFYDPNTFCSLSIAYSLWFLISGLITLIISYTFPNFMNPYSLFLCISFSPINLLVLSLSGTLFSFFNTSLITIITSYLL